MGEIPDSVRYFNKKVDAWVERRMGKLVNGGRPSLRSTVVSCMDNNCKTTLVHSYQIHVCEECKPQLYQFTRKFKQDFLDWTEPAAAGSSSSSSEPSPKKQCPDPCCVFHTCSKHFRMHVSHVFPNISKRMFWKLGNFHHVFSTSFTHKGFDPKYTRLRPTPRDAHGTEVPIDLDWLIQWELRVAWKCCIPPPHPTTPPPGPSPGGGGIQLLYVHAAHHCV